MHGLRPGVLNTLRYPGEDISMLPLRHGDSARGIHPVKCSFGAPPAQKKANPFQFVSKSATLLELHTESVTTDMASIGFRMIIGGSNT